MSPESPTGQPRNWTEQKQTGFRIFGGVLDREDSYVDVSVDGVDGDGNIYFVDGNGNSWKFQAERVGKLSGELLIVGIDDVPYPDHDLWTHLDEIGATRKDVNINNFVDQHLESAQRNLFLALMEAGRSDGN